MSSQAQLQGRYLGGRPPYGYRIADTGPHPNPSKAAAGQRIHKLELDPAPPPHPSCSGSSPCMWRA